MKRVAFCAVLTAALIGLSISVLATSLPVVRQPSDPTFSAADRTAMASAWTAIAGALQAQFTPARFASLQGLSWSETDSVQFAAGTLQAAGYAVLLATGPWTGGAARTWLLVGIPTSSGLAYVPVEAAPELLSSSSVIGQIAWQGGVVGSSFDPRYAGFAEVVALAPNAPPSISLSIADRYVVAGRPTTLVVTGGDSDGFVLAYLWTFDDGAQTADTRRIFWHTFDELGRMTVTLRAVDSHGAWMEVSITDNVVAEEPDCGCSH